MLLADDRLRLIRVKVERAYKHIEDLEDVTKPFLGPVFKTVSLQSDSDSRKPRLQFDPLQIYTSHTPAIAGDAVHNLMSALDHLAFHLVCVGMQSGIERTERLDSIQFPFAHDANTYELRKARYIQGARREAIEEIDKLKPYKGGHDSLWLLYKLDITDKHKSILAVGTEFIMDGVPFKANEPFFAGLDAPNDEEDMNISGDESLPQPSIGRANALLPTLHKLADVVSAIVTNFRPFLE